MFYRTLNGAQVGDLFMSLIHTAELCGANPFDLQELLDSITNLTLRTLTGAAHNGPNRGQLTRIDPSMYPSS